MKVDRIISLFGFSVFTAILKYVPPRLPFIELFKAKIISHYIDISAVSPRCNYDEPVPSTAQRAAVCGVN